jgi:hypothetical protein
MKDMGPGSCGLGARGDARGARNIGQSKETTLDFAGDPDECLRGFLSFAQSRLVALGLAGGLYLLPLQRTEGEDHVDYRYYNYQEGAGRIGVETHSGLFETKLAPWLSLKGEMVYDAISGATPTGAPPPSDIHTPFPQGGDLNTSVPTAHMQDERWAGSIDAAMTFGRHHITPQFAYSSEHDYTSYGAALNYALDLNQKNTTLNLGWAHAWDTVLPFKGTYISKPQDKDTDDVIIGVNQLLSPKTVLTVDFTYRASRGYLADPYRGVLFDNYPQGNLNNPSLFPEKRPDHRDTYIGYLSLIQYVTPLRGSAELSYRFSSDSYGVDSHTVGVSWHQKIGKHILISPLVRYYQQNAASFYATQFPGDPSDYYSPIPIPTYYSADYRLSHLETLTAGIDISVKIKERISIDFTYNRYVMSGLDGVTSSTAYPSANIFSVGARLWF